MVESVIRDKYEVVIGLEVHAQLLTQSKMFSPEATAYGDRPNTNISVITLAHPGTLPRINRNAVNLALRMGLAVQSEITRFNHFDRKNYFYPDLPKGYQLTQDKTPICRGGIIRIKTPDGKQKAIQLNRIHLEEDAGKSIHLEGEPDTLVDFNRAGTPLIESVTEPVINSAEEAYAFLTELRKLVRYLEICNGNMEEGSLRCDVNISVKPKGAASLGKKVEVKNLNSFSNVKRAIEHESVRQILLLEEGKAIASETRTFDAASGTTAAMRTKEELNDYRYFPEPDLSPLEISDAWLARIAAEMPSLPWEMHEKFVSQYGLPDYDAGLLAETRGMALYFDALCAHTQNYKAAANWLMGPVKGYLNEVSLEIEQFPLPPQQLADIIALVDSNKLNFSMASKQLFPLMLKNPDRKAENLAQEHGLVQESDEGAIRPIIEEVLNAYPDKVKAYRNGKKGLVGMFVGEVMKKSQGKADPRLTNQLLRELLEG